MKYNYRLADEYERPVTIEVAVEEGVTGRRQNASIQITLHKHKYTMELLRTAEYYKPGLKYTAFVSYIFIASAIFKLQSFQYRYLFHSRNVPHLILPSTAQSNESRWLAGYR